MEVRLSGISRFSFSFVLILFFLVSESAGQTNIDSGRVSLPNGWKLTPVGKILQMGDLPLNIAVSHSGRYAAVTNNGESDQTIQLIDIKNEKVLDSVVIGKSWLGLTFSRNSKYLYASGGNDNLIIRYLVKKGHLQPYDTIFLGKPWPEKISVAGIALDDSNHRLYAVTKENNSLYVADTEINKVIAQYELGGEAYTCILSPDNDLLYISCWGCDKILVFDIVKKEITWRIPVGDNPNDMCISKDGQYLYVAGANDNTVSVINTAQREVKEVLNAALYPLSPSGSTTNSVALSPDEKTLYIANADNNCLSLFDVSTPGQSKSQKFIPTGWYPTCVRTVKNKILVTNGKGMASMANPFGPNPVRPEEEVIYQEGNSGKEVKLQYIGGLFKGTMSIIPVPDEKLSALYTKAVFDNTPYNKSRELTSEGEAGNPVPMKVGETSPIKHIFYVIKENRTYDQVLGDIPEGNGDPGLVLFGEKITPNHHAVAKEFVLLDNFYVDGEVSADGHSWSMGAYATDYLEKNWPTDYGGRGGTYSGEGTRQIANNKDGYFWDNCSRQNVSYRTYGEFMSGKNPNIPVLKGHFCQGFSGWDQMIRDTARFSQWKEDFDSLLSVNALPQFNSIRFINDHTQGLKLGKPTPFAQVADNDLAVGLFIDYLSHSPVWNESLIIVVEDDAQNGPDHVDAHRSVALLAGGFVKQGFVDHTSYTTSSLLRTMELILGLPPMSQYDAAAKSLWRCFNNTAGHPAYNFRPSQVDLNEVNGTLSKWQEMSETFDFTLEDRVNDAEFNEVIWKAVKGLDSQCPPAVRAAFFTSTDVGDED